jgi:peptide deformylase
MSILKVAKMGHPILKEKAKIVSKEQFKAPWFLKLIEDMKLTMNEYGGIGLAATQVHEPWQICLMGLPVENEEEKIIVVVNPKITVLDPTLQTHWEGCLSVPGLRGQVSRPRKIQLDYLDEFGKPNVLILEDYFATVAQHEIDHLHGKVYVQKMTDFSSFGFQKELEQYHPDFNEEENEEA